jgi:DNA-binding MarR family transcriptional regulator
MDLLRVLHEMPRHVPPGPAADLTMGQIRLLFLLKREGPMPMGRVAEMFDLSSTAATGFVGRVERHGLVARRHREDDRRVVECALTESGVRFVDTMSGLRLESIRGALSVLSERELSGLRSLLGRIRERQGARA